MINVIVRPNDRGEWFSVRDDDRPMLSAHRASPLADEVTLYWRGRVDAKRLNGFFDGAIPKKAEFSVSAQMFTPDGKIRLDRLNGTRELTDRHLGSANFLRLECLVRPETGAAFEPTFIVWSRSGLEDIAPGAPAPDDIGVFMNTTHMMSIISELAAFITATHIFQPNVNLIGTCIEKLAARANQTPSPLMTA